ncbi:lipase secretion chaperone [Marinobacter sp.]|uniref:lipase secretion chaperone n=1 Tax=Marinobacter sp. TaxID=50741 RepID=UPI003850424D
MVRGEAGPLPSDVERPTIDAIPPGEETGTQPASRLQEAELEHLSEVFLNTLHTLFQYDFPLDQEARAALDTFVASMPEDLTSEDLETISAMIQAGLSSPESEDLAFIITHLYRLEQEEARLMSEGAPVTTMAQQLEAQERLAQLRDQWFGPELSELLFSGADDAGTSSDQISAGSQPAYDGMEERPEALAEAQAELADMESAWEQRYQVFLAEKQVIDRAGLDQTEKDRQIEALLQQHYIPRELEAARAFDQKAE